MCSCVTVSIYFIVRDTESPYNIHLCYIYGCGQILSSRRWVFTQNKKITEDIDTNLSSESLAINHSHALCQISKYNFVSRIQFMIFVSIVYFSCHLSCGSDRRNDSIEKVSMSPVVDSQRFGPDIMFWIFQNININIYIYIYISKMCFLSHATPLSRWKDDWNEIICVWICCSTFTKMKSIIERIWSMHFG